MSEETPQMVTSEEGAQIPVRMEGEYPTNIDTEGKSLFTGEDISPGSDALKGYESNGENIVHNPEAAQEAYNESHHFRSGALAQEKSENQARIDAARADITEEQRQEFLTAAEQHKSTADYHHAQADMVEAEVLSRYDSEHQTPEPDPNRAHYMADKDKDLQMAASMAEQVGRPEKAQELRDQAEVEAQKGAAEYDRDQRREAERLIVEARIAESQRRQLEEKRQRQEQQVNDMVDKVFDAVNLPPKNEAEIFDDMKWIDGYGSEPVIIGFYERIQLPRPNDESEPEFSWDHTEGGPSHFVGNRQVSKIKTYKIPTKFGVVIRETHYQPGWQNNEGPRIRLTVEKPSETSEAAA